MVVAILLALQAAPAAVGPVPTGMAAVDFDLGAVGTAALETGLPRRCAAPDGETIIVCGRRGAGNDYPFDDMARRFAPRPLDAELRLFGDVTARPALEAVALDRGAVSRRIMLRVRVPF
jgi:hypothetical protein